MNALSRVRMARAAIPILPSARPVARRTQPPWYALLGQRLQQVAAAGWSCLQQTDALAVLKKRQRRMRVAETVSLGDKRFVSILEVDGQAFLIASSGSNIALLASMSQEQPPFQRMLQDSLQRSEGQ